MTDISLKFLSNEIKISIKELIKELSDIGIVKNEKDQINLIEKNNLLKHLESKKKIFFRYFNFTKENTQYFKRIYY